MSTCGYVCPICEGRQLKDDGSECDWCKSTPQKVVSEPTTDEWIKQVHEGPCCGDLGLSHP